jgi:hypothetical protein
MNDRLGLKAAPAIGRTTECRHAATTISGRDGRASKAIGCVDDEAGERSPGRVVGLSGAPEESHAIDIESLAGVAFLDQA